MHDDHFLVVEVGASWAQGADYNAWLPASQLERGVALPEPHPGNFVYPGLHMGMFALLRAAGLVEPAAQMVVIRLMHAAWSLLVVVLGYRIAEHLAGTATARRVGLLLAALGWMPVVSVHQLVEVFCMPPLLAAVWWWIRTPLDRHTRATWVAIGCAWGLATGLRYQVGLAAVGFAAAVLFTHRKAAIPALVSVTASALAVFALTQISDLWVWGEPFAQLRAYFGYNTEQAGNYPQGPVYQYILTLAGLLLPPFSLLLLVAGVRGWRKWAVVVWPALLFLLFHSVFPNKQERFILPVVPLLVVAGMAGLGNFTEIRWKRRLWQASWVLNVLALIVLTPATFKRSRLEAMDLLHDFGNVENFLAVQVDSGALPPQFYWGKWTRYWTTDGSTDPAEDKATMCASERPFPDAILFYGDRHLGAAVERYKALYPSMSYAGQAPPGKLDLLMNFLNPVNSVERVLVYRVDAGVECGSE